jgi:hypothetical protein
MARRFINASKIEIHQKKSYLGATLPPGGRTPAAVGHDGRCIVLENFRPTIYFCKIEIEKILKKS